MRRKEAVLFFVLDRYGLFFPPFFGCCFLMGGIYLEKTPRTRRIIFSFSFFFVALSPFPGLFLSGGLILCSCCLVAKDMVKRLSCHSCDVQYVLSMIVCKIDV